VYDYFKAGEQEQYQFLQLPWLLIKDEQFKKLSDSSKILYSLLLNRTSLSSKNGWIDDDRNIYIIYTIEQIMEDLCCAAEKATKVMKELKDIGLIKSIRRGFGKPNLLYVMNFATSLKYQSESPHKSTDFRKSKIKNFGNRNSGFSEIEIQEFRKSKSININYSNTNHSNIESSQSHVSKITKKEENDSDSDNDVKTNKSENKKSKTPKYNIEDYNKYKQLIEINIDYEHYFQHNKDNIELIDGLIQIMIDVILTENPPTLKIGKETKNREIVKSVYLKLNSSHIEHIISQYKAQHHQITHKTSYLRTMLYTVFQEIDAYYTNQVRTDGAVW